MIDDIKDDLSKTDLICTVGGDGLFLQTSRYIRSPKPKVLGFNPLQARLMTRVVFGGRRGAGLFDATPMTEILRTGIDYRRLARNVRRGPLTAVTITATHVPTGHSTCFVAQRAAT